MALPVNGLQFLKPNTTIKPISFPSGFTFREATNDDAPAIRTLFALTQIEYGFTYDFTDRESDLMFISEQYNQPGAFFGVLWDDSNDTLAGMAALQKFTHQGNLLNNINTVELCRLYTYSEYRGKGLGRKLMQKMIEIARTMGYERMTLESHSAMIDALRLYKRVGFKEIPPYTPNEPDYSDFAAELWLY